MSKIVTSKKNETKSTTKRQPARKFETLKVLKTAPVILTDQLGKTKLHFVV